MAPSWDVLTSKADVLMREIRFVGTSSGVGSEWKDRVLGLAVSSTKKRKKWTALCDDVFASRKD